MAFSSQLDARQFLIDKISGQASRTATPLSEVEQRMLQLDLSEPQTAAGIPVETLEDPKHNYEKKIVRLLQGAYGRDRDIPEERRKYRDAVRTLTGTDHYILIIAADVIPKRRNLGNYAVYVIIALATAAMIAVLQFWTRGK